MEPGDNIVTSPNTCQAFNVATIAMECATHIPISQSQVGRI